jgi:hypothetical protein
MTMNMKLATCLLLLGALSGCTTIYFDKGRDVRSSVVTERWHHNFALALYEGSSPVNLKQECGDKSWVSVKTEQSFLNVLAGGASGVVGPLWYPKTVEVACK